MLLEVALLLARDPLGEWLATFVPFRPEHRNRILLQLQVERQRGSPEPCRVGGRIGEDHDRRFQPLRAVNGHHANLVRRLAGIALDVDRPAREPVEEPLERRGLVPFEVDRAVHQLVGCVAGGHAEARIEPAPPLQRSRQDRLEETRRRREIGDAQQLGERLMRFAKLPCPLAQLAPQRSLSSVRQFAQPVLVPADER